MSEKNGCLIRQYAESGLKQTAGTGTAGGLVYVIPSESMGRGSDELGWALTQNFIRTIPEIIPLPATIIFYNSGVKLVCEESKALDTLRDLEQQGVAIISCGTCVAYFSLSGQVKVGRDTSMPEIMKIMVEAGKVISPM